MLRGRFWRRALPPLSCSSALPWLALAFACGGAGDVRPAGAPPPRPVRSRQAAPPAGRPADAVIGYLRWREPREQVWIGLSGVLEEPRGLPAVRSPLGGAEREGELRSFAGTYRPFRLRTADGEVVLFGRGKTAAGPAERRMVLEWMRRARAEAAGGGPEDAYGLVFSWHRGAAAGGPCEEVAAFLDGEVHAGPCAAAVPGLPAGEIHGRLDAARLARLYSWFDELQPFQSDGGLEGLRADASLARLIFAGRGTRAPRPAEVAAIGDLALQLDRELTAPSPVTRPSPASPASPSPPRLRDAEPTGSRQSRGGEPARRAAPVPPPPLTSR